MKHLLLVILLTAFGAVYGQSYDHTLTKTEQSEYISTTRTMTVYRFTSSTAIPVSKKYEIVKSLELKEDVKSAKFNASNTVLTVEVIKGISVEDLNNVLAEYSVLLVTDSTPKSIFKKIQHQNSTN